LKGFRYTFSTGDRLDSGRIKGRILLAETGKIDTTLIVLLHRSEADSAIVKDRPAYITRLNGKGEFLFEQLPDRIFHLYAIKDEGGMRRLLGDEQRVAFADSSVRPLDKPDAITLYAFDLKPKAVAPSSVVPATPSIKGKPGGAAADRRLRYTNNLSEGKQDLLRGFELSLEQPLTRFDSAGIRLYTDSTFMPVPNYSVRLDSTKRKITLTVAWKENVAYRVVVDKEALKDTLDRQLLRPDTISFLTRRKADYGKLSIRFRNLETDGPNDLVSNGKPLASLPVLQLVQNESIVVAEPLGADRTFRRDLFLPGTYEMRILYDRNGNGKWDTGQLFPIRIQPERVRLLDRKITVKANWENEYEL